MQLNSHAILCIPECSILIPPPPDFPNDIKALCCHLLADIGGISSITRIHKAAQKIDPLLSRRKIAHTLQKHSHIKALGGGYYCFVEADFIPLQQWLHHWLHNTGERSPEACIQAILAHYPNGDSNSIERWLRRGVPFIKKGWKGYSIKNIPPIK